MTPLAEMLTELIRESGLTKRAFGATFGLRSSTVSHILSGRPPYSLGVEKCLLMAQKTGVSASKLLRAAGKGRLAELIEDTYGPAAERRQQFAAGHRPTIQEQQFFHRFRSMDAPAQKAMTLLVDRVVEDQGRPAPGRRLPKVAVRKG